MKSFTYLLLISASAILSSCSVSNVPLTFRQEPEISFSGQKVNVLVINRFDVNRINFFLRKEKKKDVYGRGINAEIGQLLNELESIKGINLIEKSDSLTLARNLKGNLDSTVLTVGEIKQLASKYDADYILALENYDASFVQDEVIKTKNADGSTNKIARYSLAIRSSWSLYDAAGNSFRELKGNASRYHSERTVVSALLAVGPALGSNIKFVQEVSIQAGRRVADYFKSQLISINRPLYTDKVLKVGAKAIENGNYDLAQKELEALTQHEDLTISSKAYYNLAVLAELKGNRHSAVDFAELSLQKRKNVYASMLLNRLKYSS